MSLKDTIDGAMREASDGGFSVPGAKTAEGEAPGEEGRPKRSGRGSAASAKPARERAASVRVQTSAPDGGKNRALASKEEKREIRQKERDKEDLLSAAAGVLQKRDAEYQKTERVFWVLMIVGFASTVISMVLTNVELPADAGGAYQGVISVVLLVAAYVFIIGAFVYDVAKRNKMRKAFTTRAASMSDSKKRALIEEDMAQKDAAKEAKAAKKAAKAKE